MQFIDAVRKAVPMLISIAGPSGSGKTFSALLMAAGLAGPKGTVGFIDTENGRGSMYVDSPGIKAALPNGYKILQLDAPYSPDRYITAIEAAEQAGIDVLVIDSASHEWEGIDGCCEIAEKNKLRGMPNWAKAKMAHKRFVNHCLSSRMHIVFCLRARDKVKIVDVVKDGKKTQEIVPIGLLPITEKNFVYEMLVSILLDETTHHAKPLKVPEPLKGLFPGERLISKEDGQRIREWNDGGKKLEDGEQLRKRAKAAADQGTAAYSVFFSELSKDQRKILADTDHEENKRLAKQADEEIAAMEREQAESAGTVDPDSDRRFFSDVDPSKAA